MLKREEHLYECLKNNDAALLEAGGEDSLKLEVYIQAKDESILGLRWISFRTEKGLEHALRGAIKKYRKEFGIQGVLDVYVDVETIFKRVSVPLGKKAYMRLYERINYETGRKK